MFTIRKQIRFEAAHRLPNHDGKCQRLHGHSWEAWIAVVAQDTIQQGPKAGMAMDYSDIKKACEPMLNDYLDHHYLNDTTGLEHPTSENLARWIYTQLLPSLPMLLSVEVRETCTCSCTYQPSKMFCPAYERELEG